MATALLSVSPAAPGHGDTVTATYVVSGNDGTPPRSAEVTGQATIGDESFTVSTVLTIPAVAPLPESFEVPVVDDLVFEATSNPRVFTALVP